MAIARQFDPARTMTVGILYSNGNPSFGELRNALMPTPGTTRLSVQFLTGEPALGQISAYINGVEWEDGSGHRWSITGYVERPGLSPLSFTGFYDSDTRMGNLNFPV